MKVAHRAGYVSIFLVKFDARSAVCRFDRKIIDLWRGAARRGLPTAGGTGTGSKRVTTVVGRAAATKWSGLPGC